MFPTPDPALVDLIWTLVTATFILSSGVLALLALPWSDREIDSVDRTFRNVTANLSAKHLSAGPLSRGALSRGALSRGTLSRGALSRGTLSGRHPTTMSTDPAH